MKFLLFSDLHCDVLAAERLVERAKGVDVVIGAGDFGMFRKETDLVIQILRDIDLPAVLVPGNHESADELREACRGWSQAHVLQGESWQFGNVDFFGIGGATPPTPFGEWSYDFTEEQAGEMLAACPVGAVLISHSPPKGAVDVSSEGKSLGSTAVRDAILHSQPAFVVCGHIHGSAGRTGMIGDSPVINAGPGGVEWKHERMKNEVGN